MIAEQKAKELFNIFLYAKKYQNSKNAMSVELAKQCALKSCDLIVESAKKLDYTIMHTNYGQKLIDINGEIVSKYTDFVLYWSKVKTEIENF